MTESEFYSYIKNYRRMVFRLAYSYLGNQQDAEDVSQEAFLKLYLSNEEFRTAENTKAWLIRVTINLSKNIIKSSWRRRRADMDENILYEIEEEKQLLHFVGKLKPDYRIVIHLFYYEGYSVKEISKLLNLSSAAVRTRLTRARNQLKRMLLKEGLNETGIQ